MKTAFPAISFFSLPHLRIRREFFFPVYPVYAYDGCSFFQFTSSTHTTGSFFSSLPHLRVRREFLFSVYPIHAYDGVIFQKKGMFTAFPALPGKKKGWRRHWSVNSFYLCPTYKKSKSYGCKYIGVEGKYIPGFECIARQRESVEVVE